MELTSDQVLTRSSPFLLDEVRASGTSLNNPIESEPQVRFVRTAVRTIRALKAGYGGRSTSSFGDVGNVILPDERAYLALEDIPRPCASNTSVGATDQKVGGLTPSERTSRLMRAERIGASLSARSDKSSP